MCARKQSGLLVSSAIAALAGSVARVALAAPNLTTKGDLSRENQRKRA